MKIMNPATDKLWSMNRRAFLRLSGLLGLGLATGGIIPSAAEAVRFNRKLYKVSKTRLAMGTFVSMTLIHPSQDEAEEAMGLAFEEIDRLTRAMSRFDETTAVAQLNREGVLVDVPPEVVHVVATGLDYYRISGRCFDISVKPVVDLFREKFASGKDIRPAETELNKVLGLVGSDMIELNGRTLRFKKPGMGITLDGIAKGYIVDKASEVLVSRNIKNHLINAGGDIRARGLRQDRKPWVIAIQDPKKEKRYPDIINMSDGAIATSGNYEVYFDREKMFHHIVNPSTGRSPEASTSVSVIADNTMAADALSTSVFVMDPAQGTIFINSLPGCECLVIARDGKKFKSAGWKSGAV
ncbi:MAG: FAD:protein FMN transferase [Pseudomonadota bacterium]